MHGVRTIQNEYGPDLKIPMMSRESTPVEDETSPPVKPRASSPPHATTFRGRLRAFCVLSFVTWLVAVAATWCGGVSRRGSGATPPRKSIYL